MYDNRLGRYDMATILICDDEKDIVSALDIYLSSEGYSILRAYNGAEALEAVENNNVDLVLLDVMMPVLNGIQTIMKIRENHDMPVIFLSAKSEDTDKILGLNLGADDYVTKPFNMVEVAARVRSNLRRFRMTAPKQSEDTIVIGGISLNDRSKQVTVDGDYVELTPKEYEILKLLMENPGRVFSNKEVYKAVWGENPNGYEGTVSVHIRHLREKIEVNPADPRYIQAVWGRGYRLERGR